MAPIPHQIALSDLKILGPRVFIHDSLEALPDIENEEGDIFFKFLDALLLQAGKSPDSVTLSDFFQTGVVEIMRNAVQGAPNHLSVLNKVADHIDCRECALGASASDVAVKPCHGDANHDRLLISRPGLCVAPLSRLAAITCEVARGYYREYCSNPFDLPTSFRLVHTESSIPSDELHDVPNAPYYVSGKTDLDNNYSVVELTLNGKELDAQTLRVVLYVLFHEYVVHAFQRTYPRNDERRGHCGRDDGFAEGWMDWVAIEILLDFLNGQAPPSVGAHRFDIKRVEQVKSLCQSFHAQRRNRDERPARRSKQAGMRHLGYITAAMAKAMFDELSDSDRWEAFLRLSFDLNTWDPEDSGPKAVPAFNIAARKTLMMNLRKALEPFYAQVPGRNWSAQRANAGAVQRSIGQFRYAPSFNYFLANYPTDQRGATARLVSDVLSNS